MFRYAFFIAFAIVFSLMPSPYHSLGVDFSSLIGSKNSSIGKGFHELCQYYCDESDYTDDLFGDLIDEPQPRVLCWICHKKSSSTKSVSTTTTTTMAPTTTPMTTTTTPTSSPTPTSTTTTTTPPSSSSTPSPTNSSFLFF